MTTEEVAEKNKQARDRAEQAYRAMGYKDLDLEEVKQRMRKLGYIVTSAVHPTWYTFPTFSAWVTLSPSQQIKPHNYGCVNRKLRCIGLRFDGYNRRQEVYHLEQAIDR